MIKNSPVVLYTLLKEGEKREKEFNFIIIIQSILLWLHFFFNEKTHKNKLCWVKKKKKSETELTASVLKKKKTQNTRDEKNAF